MEYKKHPERLFRHLISMPFIYMMLFPLAILHIFLGVYHQICFRLYGIRLVKRKNYVRIDRHKLKYLKFLEKLNCAYCGYANGLLNYAAAIAGETEKYWCGIKHRKYKGFNEPMHHKDFLKYGDEKSFRKKYCK
ncbi:hypothetical protein HY637_00560 [Candidatus Woesearchaeota archaeon]|nr:hypothetical protein [Candidatus Woesearchaeota archaeon]